MTTRSQSASTDFSKRSSVADDKPLVLTGHPDWIGQLAVFWGLAGVVALLCTAIVRLVSISVTAFAYSLTWQHWLVLFASVLFMAYAEGYKTFQKIWAPRVVARALVLKQHWTVIRVLLAPLYCMSFFHATRKRYMTAWITTFCIIALVVLMNRIAQPWRGLIDAGVVVGLSWGVVAVVINALTVFFSRTR